MENGIEKGSSRIISIGTAVPNYGTSQKNILQFMQKAYNEHEASRKLNLLFHHSGIKTRYSVIPDFSGQKYELFDEHQSRPFLDKRNEIYKDKALPLAISAIKDSLKGVSIPLNFSHLITVSCTGLQAPGLDAQIIEELNLPDSIFHTSLNFLGCNAAFPALKIADSFLKSQPDAKVLIVCVELCTLHFQPKYDADNLLSNTLFGDGAAAVIVVPESFASENTLKGLCITGFDSKLLSEGKNLLGWNPTSVNFEMILDSLVPSFLGSEIETVMSKILENFNLTKNAISHWAIHPGGKKILDEIERELQLMSSELKHSYHVLNKYGNMSSPSVLFVLNEILSNEINPGDIVLSMGFGPGISIESALMKYEVN